MSEISLNYKLTSTDGSNKTFVCTSSFVSDKEMGEINYRDMIRTFILANKDNYDIDWDVETADISYSVVDAF